MEVEEEDILPPQPRAGLPEAAVLRSPLPLGAVLAVLLVLLVVPVVLHAVLVAALGLLVVPTRTLSFLSHV